MLDTYSHTIPTGALLHRSIAIRAPGVAQTLTLNFSTSGPGQAHFLPPAAAGAHHPRTGHAHPGPGPRGTWVAFATSLRLARSRPPYQSRPVQEGCGSGSRRTPRWRFSPLLLSSFPGSSGPLLLSFTPSAAGTVVLHANLTGPDEAHDPCGLAVGSGGARARQAARGWTSPGRASGQHDRLHVASSRSPSLSIGFDISASPAGPITTPALRSALLPRATRAARPAAARSRPDSTPGPDRHDHFFAKPGADRTRRSGALPELQRWRHGQSGERSLPAGSLAPGAFAYSSPRTQHPGVVNCTAVITGAAVVQFDQPAPMRPTILAAMPLPLAGVASPFSITNPTAATPPSLGGRASSHAASCASRCLRRQPRPPEGGTGLPLSRRAWLLLSSLHVARGAPVAAAYAWEAARICVQLRGWMAFLPSSADPRPRRSVFFFLSTSSCCELQSEIGAGARGRERCARLKDSPVSDLDQGAPMCEQGLVETASCRLILFSHASATCVRPTAKSTALAQAI